MDSAMPKTSLRLGSFRAGLAALALAAVVPTAAVAQVVVVANGSPITAYDIEQRTKLMATSTHKTPARQEVIQELIDDRIKIAKAKSYGFEIGDAEVEEAYNNMAKAQHVTTAQFSQMIERSGIAPSTIKARIRAELTWTQLVRGKFSSSLQVGDSDVSNALRSRNEADTDAVGYIYTLYPIMVLVPQGSPPAAIESKRRDAESLRGRFASCKEGLPFARALRDVAVREPLTRSSSDLPEQLRAVLAETPVGHLTAPDVTGQGLQMFALCDKKESKTDSPLKRETRQQLFAKRYDAEAKRYLDEIRKQAMIEYKEGK
jgi:peptidyl-prolyl cis-trans isomerase SurA